MERTRLISKPVDPKGCATIYQEPDGTYTVELGDLYATYTATPGFKTFKKALAEYKMYS